MRVMLHGHQAELTLFPVEVDSGYIVAGASFTRVKDDTSPAAPEVIMVRDADGDALLFKIAEIRKSPELMRIHEKHGIEVSGKDLFAVLLAELHCPQRLLEPKLERTQEHDRGGRGGR